MLYRLKYFIQTHKREILLFVIFFLVSTISFALGYLIAKEISVAPIVIEKR